MEWGYDAVVGQHQPASIGTICSNHLSTALRAISDRRSGARGRAEPSQPRASVASGPPAAPWRFSHHELRRPPDWTDANPFIRTYGHGSASTFTLLPSSQDCPQRMQTICRCPWSVVIQFHILPLASPGNWEPDLTDPDDLRYNLRISVWVRWFLLDSLAVAIQLPAKLRI